MRILHLATSRHGGAGIAAVRLHDALIAEGCDSTLLTLEEISKGLSINLIKQNLSRKFFTIINQLNTRKGFISTSTFSRSSINTEDLTKYSPDIVHIHNWYNLLSTDTILNIVSRYSTVITMHDERLITGSCHYSLECKGYLSNCLSCPVVRTFHRTVSKEKSELPTKISDRGHLAVIAPSQWLIDRFKVTSLAKKVYRTKVIPNIVFVPELFKSDKKVPISDNQFNLLFAAVNPEAPTKGLDLLVEAVTIFAKLNPSVEIILHIVGKELALKPKLKNLIFVLHGFQSSSAMKSCFDKVDLVVVPSLIDNSPSIISEAQLNGTLVLATNVGGIPELITDSISGLVCEPTVNSLASSLQRAFNLENKEDLISAAYWQASDRHNREKIVQEHIHLYRELKDYE